MPSRIVENFVDHPVTRVVDAAALATGVAYVVPEWRAAIHGWGLLAGDIAPIFAVVWLAVQIPCKIMVTWKGKGKWGCRRLTSNRTRYNRSIAVVKC